jgi:hypothetical protein
VTRALDDRTSLSTAWATSTDVELEHRNLDRHGEGRPL